MKFKDLIKTTEGIFVLGGLFLTLFSPIFSPKFWAVATGVAYVLINVPEIINKLKNWYNDLNSGDTN